MNKLDVLMEDHGSQGGMVLFAVNTCLDEEEELIQLELWLSRKGYFGIVKQVEGAWNNEHETSYLVSKKAWSSELLALLEVADQDCVMFIHNNTVLESGAAHYCQLLPLDTMELSKGAFMKHVTVSEAHTSGCYTNIDGEYYVADFEE